MKGGDPSPLPPHPGDIVRGSSWRGALFKKKRGAPTTRSAKGRGRGPSCEASTFLSRRAPSLIRKNSLGSGAPRQEDPRTSSPGLYENPFSLIIRSEERRVG